jgi:class 3 adenylate cyclase
MRAPFEFLNERKNEIDRVIKEEFDIQSRNSVPSWEDIPLEGKKWLQADNLTCVYIDMVGSTKLQVVKQAKVSAKVYQLFVDNMVQTLQDYDCEFVDIKGDGGFGIFIGEHSAIKALCAAVTFKTLCHEMLASVIKDFKISAHIGIDQKHALFKKIGLRGGDWQNVVWAGKPVNMAAKLSTLAGAQEIAISSRVYDKINLPKFKKYAYLSCGCSADDIIEPTSLWTEVDVAEKSYFDFEKAYICKSNWCKKHGNEYCLKLMKEAE